MSDAPIPTPEPAIQVAARLLAEGQPAQAVERLAALVDEAPTYAAAHVLHATALETAGHVEAALVAWSRAAALVPRSPLVHRERERLLAAHRPSPQAAGDELPPAIPLHDDPQTEDAPTPSFPAVPPPSGDDEPVPLDVSALLFGGAVARADPEPPTPDAPDEDDGAEGAEAPPAWTDHPFSPTDLLPPEGEAPSVPDDAFHVPDAPDVSGWAVLAEEDVPTPPPGTHAEPDVVAPDDEPAPADDSFAVADELDALIAQLEDAPRIRPDPAFSGPEVTFDDGGVDDMASETLAKIYAAQHQYVQAALVYETLAARQPEKADDLLRRAAEMRERG